ncbi:hypothetical protein D3C73_1650850 [compost metagenome]
MRQLGASFVDFGQIALLKFTDEFVSTYCFCGGDNFFLGGIESAVTDIVQDGS